MPPPLATRALSKSFEPTNTKGFVVKMPGRSHELLAERMEAVGQGLSVPLVAEFGIGANWDEAHG